MEVHLVGGFLGSGKTTAIAGAARALIAVGRKVGIVTNDQGALLVDRAFLSRTGAPTVSVGGGCFCCKYDDLEARLLAMEAEHTPDVVFCEAVGSCADLVATVLRPLESFAKLDVRRHSVFADARLLLRRLNGDALPFSDDVLYVFDLQLEEAKTILVNKVDLLDDADRDELTSLVNDRFSGRAVEFVSIKDPADVRRWLERSEAGDSVSLDRIDYERYGRGDTELAWLDATVSLGTNKPADVAEEIMRSLFREGIVLAHLKVEVDGAKASVTTMDADLDATDLPESGETMLLNVRADADAMQLDRVVCVAIRRSGAEIDHLATFHPGKPKPVHRLA